MFVIFCTVSARTVSCASKSNKSPGSRGSFAVQKVDQYRYLRLKKCKFAFVKMNKSYIVLNLFNLTCFWCFFNSTAQIFKIKVSSWRFVSNHNDLYEGKKICTWKNDLRKKLKNVQQHHIGKADVSLCLCIYYVAWITWAHLTCRLPSIVGTKCDSNSWDRMKAASFILLKNHWASLQMT
jgi:hypothetical protein